MGINVLADRESVLISFAKGSLEEAMVLYSDMLLGKEVIGFDALAAPWQ